ncbi:hypothetical protein [Bordetella petrii]|uniref:hypothetical protein n=1 Tax=Bordetella petrii TaxID=94624 RepID=UPI00048E31BA|nr:hypothetical protein [Bordetella petrii]
MSTIATRLTGVTPAPNAPIIVLPSDKELAILNSPYTVEWWRADYNFDNNGWTGRKGGLRLTTNAPGALSKVPGDLGLTCINRTTAQGGGNVYTTLVSPAGSTTWPTTGGYTFAWVAKFNAAASTIGGAIVANTVQAGAYVGYGNNAAPSRFVARHNSLVTQTDSVITPDVAKAVVWSYSYVDRVGVVMDSAGEVLHTTSLQLAANVPTDGRISLFGNRDETGSFISAGGFNGDLYDLIIFNKAVHKNESARDMLLAYILERYGDAV